MRLIALNTIGLTGIEILQARLAELKDVSVLPGQNFTLFRQNLYRPHDYSGLDGKEIFQILSRHLLTKAGRIWMGLTKYMDAAARQAYRPEHHEACFIAKINGTRSFFGCLQVYCDSYFESMGERTLSSARCVAFYSNNIALNLPAYKESHGPARILNLENSIDYWLASISQTRTWDCLEACRFWLVNNLYLRYFQTKHAEYQSFNLERLIDEPDREMAKICAFLDVSDERTIHRSEGVIKPNPSIIEATRANAALLRKIYCNESLFTLADRLNAWSSDFLLQPSVPPLLDRFAEFWNSTSHTNFDWIGPIGDEIVDLALHRYGSNNRRDLNVRFYHDYFKTHSDRHVRIEAHLHHFLGVLESEIVIPHLPYFLKVAIEYLASISRNYVFHSHSYIPVRQSNIYKRLIEPTALEKIAIFGLTTSLDELESAIDEAEQSCNYLRAPTR